LYLGSTFEGKEHDKTILEEDEVSFKEEISCYLDLAYLNLKIQNMKATIPHKKPKGGELTSQQKHENKEKSRIRVAVEHSICAIKRMFTLKYKLRVKKYYQHDQLMLLGCGLHNFRVKSRYKAITH
jgi:DDE superfamily endonuclease